MVSGSPEKVGASPRDGDDDSEELGALGEPADAEDQELDEIRYQVEDLDESSSAPGSDPPEDGRPRPTVYARELDEDSIDPDAAKVVRRLVRHGYEAYLVGGCVRDLLLERRPKDFDVCTSALVASERPARIPRRLMGERVGQDRPRRQASLPQLQR
jgi:hypothetical protein